MFVAVFATVVAIASGIYYYKTKDNKTQLLTKPNIVGVWGLDSTTNFKDSTNQFLQAFAILNDSIKLEITSDSTYLLNNKLGLYNVANDTINFIDSTAKTSYGFVLLNDSSFTIKLDSANALVFKKK